MLHLGMRVFASILTVFVLLLLAAPIIAHSKEIKKEKYCCKSKKTEEKRDNCCDKGCNPFLSCCGGMGFTFQKTEIVLQENFHSEKTFNFHYQAINSTYNNKLWLPPKV